MNSKLHRNLLAYSVCLAVALCIGVGCETEPTPPIEPAITKTIDPVEDTGTRALPEVDLNNLLFGPSGLQVVYFDFDKSAIRGDTADILKKNADLIKQAPGVLIQVAGHCDERGTQEYNVALGERRALAIRDYLIDLGISGNRMVTISYGEEMPADPGHSDAAWAKNRRAEFNKAQQ